MNLDSQYWDNFFAYEGYRAGEPYVLDDQADALLENAFVATLNAGPEQTAWHNIPGYFDHLQANCPPAHVSAIPPSYPVPQPPADGAVFQGYYPDSLGTVSFDHGACTSTFPRVPSQQTVRPETYAPQKFEMATVTPSEKGWAHIPRGTSSSSSDVSVAPASPPLTLLDVEFDCFTGPMVVPPGKEHQPHVGFAILHVHRLRTSPSVLNPQIPPIHGPSGIPYVDLVWNPTCPNMMQQKWKYLSTRTMSTTSAGSTRKGQSSQVVRCGECGEAFARRTELERHQRTSCKMREIFERIQCRLCMRIIAARDDGFVRHLRTCKGPDAFAKERN